MSNVSEYTSKDGKKRLIKISDTAITDDHSMIKRSAVVLDEDRLDHNKVKIQ